MAWTLSIPPPLRLARHAIRDLGTEYEALRPTMAKTYPFELDTFQKEAVVHMEHVGIYFDSFLCFPSFPCFPPFPCFFLLWLDRAGETRG